jgi:hypothetical protein
MSTELAASLESSETQEQMEQFLQGHQWRVLKAVLETERDKLVRRWVSGDLDSENPEFLRGAVSTLNYLIDGKLEIGIMRELGVSLTPDRSPNTPYMRRERSDLDNG